jgi:hypothetical protein
MRNPFKEPINVMDITMVIFYIMVLSAIYFFVTYNPKI